MKITDEIRRQFTVDSEAGLFLDHFDEPEWGRILEVGARGSGTDDPLSTILARSGFNVTSVDLYEYEGPKHILHHHLVGDFCRLASEKHFGTNFDCIFSISALEHFGLGAYGEAPAPYYDTIAVRYMWDLLKEGGSCYLTVPFGGRLVEVKPHWRVYDMPNLVDRLVQDFTLQAISLIISEEFSGGGQVRKVGETPSFLDALLNLDGFPGISVLLKMRKISKDRKGSPLRK